MSDVKDVKPINYQDCADALLKMWIENVLTDGEYYRIIEKLNKWQTLKAENSTSSGA